MSFDAGLAEGNRREREGESGELECISGLRQVVHCCNSYLRDGGSLKGGCGGEQVGGGDFCSKLLLGNTCGISYSLSLKCQS